MNSETTEFTRLMARVREGSQEAAWELVATYGEMVFRVVRRIMPEELCRVFDTEDFVQICWATVFRHRSRLHGFESASNFVAFLTTVAANRVRSAQCFVTGTEGTGLDERSDIFSLGVLLHEMLCGGFPFGSTPRTLTSRKSVEELVQSQMEGQKAIDWARFGVDDRLSAIIDRCLAIDSGERYESAALLVADLIRELSDIRRGRRWIRSHRRIVRVFAGSVIVAGIGSTVWLASREPYAERECKKAVVCLAEKEHLEAIDHCTNAIDAEKGHRRALFSRSCAFIAMGKYLEAFRDLSAADELCRDGRQCALLGYSCNYMRVHSEAAFWYQRSIECGFRSAGVFNNLGYSHYLQGKHERAIEALDVAISMGHRPWVTYLNRATVRRTVAVRDGTDPTEAMRDIEIALAHGHSTASTYYTAATIYAYASSFDETWKRKTRKYIELALEHGAPARSLKSDMYVAALIEEPGLFGKSWGDVQTADSMRAVHLFHPLD